MPVSQALLLCLLAPAADASTHAAPSIEAATLAVPQNPKAVPTLGRWVRDYQRGKIDVGNTDKNIASKSLAKKAGLIDKDTFDKPHGRLKEGQFCYRDEIEVLLKAAVAVNDDKAAHVILECAAAGLDPNIKWRASMNPWYVRKQALEQVKNLSSESARGYLAEAAKGNPRGNKKGAVALQATALMVLGIFKESSHMSLIQDQLKSEHPLVRGMAAEGLVAYGRPQLLKAILEALDKEKDLRARNHMLQAVMKIASQANTDQATFQKCQQVAGEVVLKGTWRDSYWGIDFARFSRSPHAAPKLIELLCRFVEKPELIAEGQLSGVQRWFAYDTLADITGCFYPIDDVKAWRDYWNRVKDDFKGTKPGTPRQKRIAFEKAEKERLKGGANAEEATTEKRPATVGMSDSDIYGTPVKGSRVLFVIDCSNTIEDPMEYLDVNHRREALKNEKRLSRLDAVKYEFTQAIEKLTPDTYFNIVSAGIRPRSWQKRGPVPATPANKKSGVKFIKSMGKSGWSNTWDGLELGLGIEDTTFGNPGSHNIDEVFFAMVRQPEEGKINHPYDIVDAMAAICELSKTRLNTYYVGAEADEHDKNGIGKQTARLLAERTGGKFVRP